jgi:thioredoxin-related protein
MKRLLGLVVMAWFTLGFAHAAEAAWLTDYQEAKKQAAAENKPLVVNFTGSDWCIWCVRLDKEVFSQPEFVEYAKDNVVLLKLDFPRGKPQSAAEKKQNEELAGTFGVEGFPTIIVLDAEAKPVGKLGYQKGGAAKWIESLEKVTKK